ncbi:MAG: methyltransferase domain-containing protein [Deltaproteobacteria bacterium]|nr:methyltransferase domain-containing protein [Deltaproteobacteria bacterium]
MPKDSYRIGSKVYDILIEPFLVKIKWLTVKILLKRFNKPPDVRFLEVACGTGTLSHLLSKRGYNVFALDKSYNMIRHTHGKIDGSYSGSVTAILGDASTMPFYSDSFDAVIIQLGLHEMKNNIRMDSGKEMIRVAKPNAVFLIFDFTPTENWSFSKLVLFVIEFFAGIDHFRNGRKFLKDGGLVSFLKNLNLEIKKKAQLF